MTPATASIVQVAAARFLAPSGSHSAKIQSGAYSSRKWSCTASGNRPVVASPEAHEGVRAIAGRDLLVADGAEAMATAVRQVLAGGMPGLGAAARAAVLAGHDWKATLTRLDGILEAPARIKAA